MHSLEAVVKGREFLIESIEIGLEEDSYWTVRVWEADSMLNVGDTPPFTNHEDAIQYGWEFVKRVTR